MEHCDLVKKLQELTMENENLKNKNLELTKKLGEQKNWTGIREGELLPRLRKRYGYIGPCSSYFLNPISQIVRELLNIKKLSEVNETNYDIAKEISIGLMNVICEYDWPNLERLQKTWEGYKHVREF
ncbi:hypothetical protein [Clostridium kluyveri]|uniref:Uncharacterized protein n=1 Tax=Clostridium kluyveri TaxID=1534 RepID=A0A1L5F8T0_CLOKL|nr:hypothetical protein [Clostridium kluyveri]APM39436.1 hypothetical protein BS101_12120 [Clostridium kluyveri]